MQFRSEISGIADSLDLGKYPIDPSSEEGSVRYSEEPKRLLQSHKPSTLPSELGTSGSSFHGSDDVDEVVDQKDLLIPLILCLFFHSVISDVGF